MSKISRLRRRTAQQDGILRIALMNKTNIIQNEPNQANYGADLDVNVYLCLELNLNFRDPRSGALKVGSRSETIFY